MARAYHIGIRKDAAKNLFPLSYLNAGGITFHSFSAVFNAENDANLYAMGKVEKLEEHQLVLIRRDLRVDRRPVIPSLHLQVCSEDAPPLTVRLGSEDVPALMVRERRLPDGRVSREYRDMPYGRGRVIQWIKTGDGWRSEQINLQDPNYHPVASASQVDTGKKDAKGAAILETVYVKRSDKGELVAEEVAVSSCVYMLPAQDPDFAPPPMDMTGIDRGADKIEDEEERLDPSGFEQAKAQARRAKGAPAEAAKG